MANEEYLRPDKGVKFSKDNQPSGEAKKAGKRRAKALKDVCSQLVTGKSKEALESLAKYLGLEVDEIDIELALHLKQIQKALNEGDTKAYNSVMDRLKGRPKQEIDHTTKGDKIQDKQFEVKIIPPPEG